MSRVQSLTISSPLGVIPGLLHLPDHLPAPVVVCCHGLDSSKESSKFIAICNALCHAGIAALRFDFCGCGESRAQVGINLLASRMDELRAVLNTFASDPRFHKYIGLLGSSLGGYLVLLASAEARVPIASTVCWATPFDLAPLQALLYAYGEARGLTAPPFESAVPFHLRDIKPVANVLLLHGQEDESVPWADSVEIYRRLSDPKRLHLFEQVEHRFLDDGARAVAIRESVDWFVSHGIKPAQTP